MEESSQPKPTYDPTAPHAPPQSQQAQPPNAGMVMNSLYQRVGSEAEAQACAWVYSAPGQLERYYYRHPQLAPHDVRSRVLFTSICHTDIAKGNGDMPMAYPCCLGHEGICEVIAVGDKVSAVKIGDKIMCGPVRDSCMQCDMCKASETQMCTGMPDIEKQNINGKYFGTFSTHLQQPESHCFKVPDGITLETAAPFACAGITMFRPLTRWAKKGDHIAIIGLGGLGHLAVQFSLSMGYIVDVMISKRDLEQMHDIIALGASKVIEWDDADCLGKAQNTYDAIFNTLPVSLPCEKMDALTRTIKSTGKLIQIGVPPSADKFVVSTELIVRRDIEVNGSMCAGKKDTEAMLKYINSNNINCHCDFYDFNDFPKAIDHASHQNPNFRTVVRVDQASRKFVQ